VIPNADRKVLVFWLIAVALITSRELSTEGLPLGLPRPSAYVGSAIVYGAAAIVAEFAPALGVVAAGGWTLAIAYGSLQARKRGATVAPQVM
jgi:hypothetical protein